jgi:NADH-quinone oxidoreductase subunit F
MTVPTDHELTQRWRDEPAPLLPLLHAFHDRDGVLSDEALRQVSRALDIPMADLYGTVTFYHHLSRQESGSHAPTGATAPRVCTGPVCCMRGGLEILEALKAEGATAMPCAGRCDDPVPVLRGAEVLVGETADSLQVRPSPLPPTNPGGVEECVFAAVREPGRATIDGYRKTKGYEGLERAVSMSPADVIGAVSESKLAGRGGAGFPTGVKWNAVAEASDEPKSIVCNADEGEPGCFKDRAIMDYDPHGVIEGMTIAAYATGATRGFIYLRYEYPETLETLERVIAEAESAGYLGEDILGKGFTFRIDVRRGAGAYKDPCSTASKVSIRFPAIAHRFPSRTATRTSPPS